MSNGRFASPKVDIKKTHSLVSSMIDFIQLDEESFKVISSVIGESETAKMRKGMVELVKSIESYLKNESIDVTDEETVLWINNTWKSMSTFSVGLKRMMDLTGKKSQSERVREAADNAIMIFNMIITCDEIDPSNWFRKIVSHMKNYYQNSTDSEGKKMRRRAVQILSEMDMLCYKSCVIFPRWDVVFKKIGLIKNESFIEEDRDRVLSRILLSKVLKSAVKLGIATEDKKTSLEAVISEMSIWAKRQADKDNSGAIMFDGDGGDWIIEGWNNYIKPLHDTLKSFQRDARKNIEVSEKLISDGLVPFIEYCDSFMKHDLYILKKRQDASIFETLMSLHKQAIDKFHVRMSVDRRNKYQSDAASLESNRDSPGMTSNMHESLQYLVAKAKVELRAKRQDIDKLSKFIRYCRDDINKTLGCAERGWFREFVYKTYICSEAGSERHSVASSIHKSLLSMCEDAKSKKK